MEKRDTLGADALSIRISGKGVSGNFPTPFGGEGKKEILLWQINLTGPRPTST
jgi:hypothetical protein